MRRWLRPATVVAMPRILAVLLDVIVVFAFAAIGRASHGESLQPDQWLRTAAPFLAGALIGWVAMMLRPLADTIWRQGLIVWACTLGLGMVFRLLVRDGVQVSFVIVAGLTLAVGFFGWRGIATLIGRLTSRSA